MNRIEWIVTRNGVHKGLVWEADVDKMAKHPRPPYPERPFDEVKPWGVYYSNYERLDGPVAIGVTGFEYYQDEDYETLFRIDPNGKVEITDRRGNPLRALE